MIRRVTLKYFKRFESQSFDLSDSIVLAGPNNSGKSTLLQALSVWSLAIQRWLHDKGVSSEDAASQSNERDSPHPLTGEFLIDNAAADRAATSDVDNRDSDRASSRRRQTKKRLGVAIARKDFTAIPLRDLDLLWHERRTAYRRGEGGPDKKPGFPKPITIEVEGDTDGDRWRLPVDLRYTNHELLYAIPAVPDPHATVASVAKRTQVVHVPPFSGIGAEETRYDRAYQDLLIGQGKPGDILRNLLLQVHNSPTEGWSDLCKDVKELFGYTLLEPTYDGRPFILCEYVPERNLAASRSGGLRLDIASAGSGLHQVLMLLGFFYARPASVLLLDEPDAHQHVILQRHVYDRLRLVARRRQCQLLIATHSEVILEATSAEGVMSFYGKPHLLQVELERDQVREAMKRLTAMDLLLAEEHRGILYTEGGDDLGLLREWARVLDHPSGPLLQKLFWHNNFGRNPKEARAHHFALRAVAENAIKGILLLDGDNRGLPDRELIGEGLEVLRWNRYEVENYLIVADALERFVSQMSGSLFAQTAFRRGAEFLRNLLPPAVLKDPLGEHDYLNVTPASKNILPPLFDAIGIQVRKSDYHQIAATMRREEIHPEIGEKLDQIAAVLGPLDDENHS